MNIQKLFFTFGILVFSNCGIWDQVLVGEPCPSGAPQISCSTNKDILRQNVVWPLYKSGANSQPICQCMHSTCLSGSKEGDRCLNNWGICSKFVNGDIVRLDEGILLCKKINCMQTCPSGTVCKGDWCEPTSIAPLNISQ